MAQTIDLLKDSSFTSKMDALIAALTPKTIPSGVVVMWSGASTAIPDGFVLCDGNNGTPNLTGKFIVGGTATGATGSIGNVEVGPQIQYYTLCYIMKT